jgi:myosin-5
MSHVLIQDELDTFRVKAEDLENKLFEVQQQSDELSKETQERASKINELQEMIARYYEFIALEFGQIYL